MLRIVVEVWQGENDCRSAYVRRDADGQCSVYLSYNGEVVWEGEMTRGLEAAERWLSYGVLPEEEEEE